MNYPKTAAKAEAMIRKAGVAMALRVTTPGTYDPASGTETGSVVTDHTCVGVLTNINQKYVDGQRILASDKMAIIGSSVAVRPKPGDVLVVSGASWAVLDVISVSPAGEDIIYKLQVRRG